MSDEGLVYGDDGRPTHVRDDFLTDFGSRLSEATERAMLAGEKHYIVDGTIWELPEEMLTQEYRDSLAAIDEGD